MLLLAAVSWQLTGYQVLFYFEICPDISADFSNPLFPPSVVNGKAVKRQYFDLKTSFPPRAIMWHKMAALWIWSMDIFHTLKLILLWYYHYYYYIINQLYQPSWYVCSTVQFRNLHKIIELWQLHIESIAIVFETHTSQSYSASKTHTVSRYFSRVLTMS